MCWGDDLRHVPVFEEYSQGRPTARTQTRPYPRLTGAGVALVLLCYNTFQNRGWPES